MYSPLAYYFSSYSRELNFGQTIRDQIIEVLLGTWGTSWEHDKNLLGTHWEQAGKKENKKKINVEPSICSHLGQWHSTGYTSSD